MLNFKRILTPLQLTREKSKDYRNVVIIQVLMIGSGMLLAEGLDPLSPESFSKAITVVMSGFAAIYTFLLWDLLRNFTGKLWLIRSIFILIFLVVMAGLITEFPYYQVLRIEPRRYYLLFLHGSVFLVELIVIGYTLRDVFSGKFLTSDKLWGAACIYLMIGIAFASLYDILNFIRPGCLGTALVLGLPSYGECIYHSFSILGGIDSIYDQPVKVVRNLSVIESVWGNLFVVLIIGKLLSLPAGREGE